MLNLIEKWLSLFGESSCFLLEEGDSQTKRTFEWWKNYKLDTLYKANQEQPYSLNFTPNGNLGKANHVGEKVVHKASSTEDYISSLYIDIDAKDASVSDLDKLLKQTLDCIWNDKLPVQYITTSGGGYHLWMFVTPEQRHIIGEKYSNKVVIIQEALADMFDGGCKESHGMHKLMRVPFSKYWKSKPSKTTGLLKVIWGEESLSIEDITTPEQITLDEKLNLKIENLEVFFKNIQKIEIIAKKGQTTLGEIGTAQINTLSIVDVIEKLKKYPREYGGATYEFSMKGNRIVFRINGQLYIPDGYKVNKETNYVHNFSMESHPMFERPRGPVFAFLYNYFNKDITLVNKFLTDEYNISLVKGEGNEGMYLCIPTESGYIYFTDKGVFYGKSLFDKKKETYRDVQVKLFDVPIFVKGIIRTKYDLFGETDEENFFYIIYNQKENTEIIIEFTQDRKAFNKKYGKKGLIFVGDEFDLLDFYNGINKATSIVKEYDLRYLNGYYDDNFIIGDTVYNKSFTPINIDDTNILLKTQVINAIRGQTEITLTDFGDRLCKVFSKRQSMTSLVTFVALLMGHKYWVPLLEKYKQQVLMPGLFLSGTTRSGKTTLLTILKNGAGMTTEARKYSIVSTSPQPIKQAASDDFILHLEEFTGEIGEVKETIVRDILNKAKSARGQSDGGNVYYIYRSSLVLDGEKLPKSESVANRCIVVPMFDTTSEKIGTEKTLSDMIGVSFMKDFIEKLYSTSKEDVLKYFKQAEMQLRQNGILDRSLLLYSFLLTVNKIFNIFLEDELIESFQENLKLHKDIDKQNNVLSNLLAELILKNRSIPTNRLTDDGWMVSIPFTHEFKMSNKIMIMDVMKQYPDNIKHLGNTIFIKVKVNDDTPSDADKNIYDVVIPYKSYFRTVH